MLLCQTFVHCTIFSTAAPVNGSYPCFSVDVAVHTFIPATDLRLGWLLPIQLTNPLSAPLYGWLPILYSPVRLSTCMCWSPSLALSLRQYQTLSSWSSFDLVVFPHDSFNLFFSLIFLLSSPPSPYMPFFCSPLLPSLPSFTLSYLFSPSPSLPLSL